MDANCEMKLPDSGLAEDILARFMCDAQQEVNSTRVDSERVAGQTVHHLVTFNLGKEEYGVAIESVQEIIRATDITPVPGAPAHVRGVINLRGKIIPVIDVRKRFALPEIADGDAQRIVVVELGDKRLGMLVDSVSQVIKISAGVVETLPEEATTLNENYIKGVGKLDNRLIIILNLNNSLLLV
jgi:purine-binding chemotaxis protein CheW